MSEVEKEAVKHACRNWKVADKRWLNIWHSVISPPGGKQAAHGTSSQRCQGLPELFNRPWFERVWIIQEVANARRAKVTCDAKSVSARIFALSPTWVLTEPSPHCQAILDVMPGPTRNSSWWMQDHNFYTLLIVRESQASDPRDRIYALLDISSNVSTTDILRPDCEMSEVEVIQHTIAFLLNLPGGPSCFPDWTLPRFLQNLERLDVEVLLWAAGHGSLTTVEALLHGKSGSNIRDHNGQTPLLLASENSHMDVVDLLLATDKVGINVQNAKGQTPLLLAIENGHREWT
ncbi:hypothetical protein E8E11_003397 [Didymella keratinophila]|nr:hypothetical protein E8E11_003397 [Didymella keratinophila]